MAVPAFFAVAVPLIVIPAALASRPLAILCAMVLGLAAVAPIVGLERIGSAFILAGFATVSFNDVHPIGGVGWMELCDPFLLIGFFLLIPRLLGNPLRLPIPYLIGAIGLLTIGTFSALGTDEPGQNFSHLLDVTQGLVFIPVFLAWWRPGRRTVIALAVAYMLGNCYNVFAALIEGPGNNGRYAGLTTHPNVMGICEVLSISLMPFLMAELRARHHWLVVVMTAISMYGVWMTGSRAAFASAVLLVLLFPLFNRSIPAALAIGAMFLAAYAVADRLAQHADPSSTLGRLMGEGSAQGSDQARLEGARLGWEQFIAHPMLGDGWLAVWGAHDGYLQVAAATGIFGLASYLLLLSGLLRPILAVPRPYGLLATPAIATIMLDIFLPVLGARYVWLVVGLAIVAARLAGQEDEGDDAGKGPVRSAEPSWQGGRP